MIDHSSMRTKDRITLFTTLLPFPTGGKTVNVIARFHDGRFSIISVKDANVGAPAPELPVTQDQNLALELIAEKRMTEEFEQAWENGIEAIKGMDVPGGDHLS